MAARLCAHCGKPLPRNASPRAKYCSDSCRVLACRKRRNSRNDQAASERKRHDRKPAPEPAVSIDRHEFERMMDDSLEDVLRRNRDRLQAAMDDPDTPASALPAISRQLISVCRELESIAGGDPLLDLDDEPTEVSEDAGAAIV
ncbi:hypothetical protein JS533_001630 [Bifidobacterium amazonense]|uniref:HIT-type domain-containing protein n=1 Tax=Bifidobacterium amazonense TaxID=2809027 RepID=A0ABS9VSD0_9BIFI|nr:hypothetical protein [Bifidobacterium amazonense]MCH9274989.1 hypothetical protein [Bifidobacterium amazonense]